MSQINLISPRVLAVAGVVNRFSREELAQLVELIPTLKTVEPAAIPEIEAVAYFRDRALERRGGYLPLPDEDFVAGLSFKEYFALSLEDEEKLWKRLFETGRIDITDFEERPVKANVRLSARQKPRS